jgi:MFS family permease
LGGGACILAGFWADRIGKAQVALAAMCASGAFAVLSALSFGGPAWLTVVLVVGWGLTVIPDSAQFSALVADHAPAQLAGSLLSLQTALGFMLTIAVVQAVPMAASWMGWPVTLALMALGPCLGVVAMSRLIVVTRVRP